MPDRKTDPDQAPAPERPADETPPRPAQDGADSKTPHPSVPTEPGTDTENQPS